MNALAAAAAATLAIPAGSAAGAQGDAEEQSPPQPYSVNAQYTGETWWNTRGGLRRSSRYLDNLDLTLEVDVERAWGVRGLKLFAYFLHNNGHEVSATLIGDAQAASNIEAAAHPLLYEFWAEWTFGERAAHSFRLGLYDLNSEFDASEVAGLFVNSAHGIGAQFAQAGLNGPSIFPVTSFGARWHWQPVNAWQARLAVLDGVPGNPDAPRRTTLALRGGEGLLLVGEVAHGLADGMRLALGGWQYTARFQELRRTDGSQPVWRRSNRGVYALGEARLWRSATRDTLALDGYARFGTADGRLNRFDQFFGAGVVLSGVLASRASDQLGLGITAPRNGRSYRSSLREQGTAADRREYAIELTYRADIGRLTLQPVVQYIKNPDTNPAIRDALAVALRVSYSLELGGP